MEPMIGIDLVEEAVKPENHFDNIDWILGNHTDELTPWIPVIAARSKANFWLLPCCFFDFFSKWNNDGKSSSQVRRFDPVRLVEGALTLIDLSDSELEAYTRNPAPDYSTS